MKLPKGMFRRGSRFYARSRDGGTDRWISLGAQYGEAKEALVKLRLGESSTARLTVKAACERWLNTYVRTARNALGQKVTTSRAKIHLYPALGHRQLGSLKPDDLRRFRLRLEESGLAGQTVKHQLSDLGCLLNWAVSNGHLQRSPVPHRWLPRLQERLPDRLRDEEVEAVVRIPEPYGFVLRLGIGTGLRWAELCRSEASHFENGVLHVSRTKSGKVRRIPVSASLAGELRSRLGRLAPFNPAQPGAFSKTVRRLSGVETFHTHQMRHTFACRWLEAGGSLPALQQILGHASVATTQRYGRLSDESVQEQARKVWGD